MHTTVPACHPWGMDDESEGRGLRHSYAQQIDDIKADVVKLAARTGEMVGAATQALLDSDLALVDRVSDDREELRRAGVDIEQRVFEVFATQNPVASDLRTLVAVLRIVQELDLTIGLMRNVARGARRLYPAELSPRVRGLFERMGAQASVQLHLATDAFADQDTAAAAALQDMDDVMDDLQKDLFRAIFADGASNDAELQRAVQTAFLGRDYERTGDHAVMIGRWTEFLVSGEFPPTV